MNRVILMGKERWIDLFDSDTPGVLFRNNKNCTFNDIEINIYPQRKFEIGLTTPKEVDPSYFDCMRITTNALITTTPVEKQIELIERLSKFLNIVSSAYVEPTIRILALYSGFSTIWEQSNTSDLAQMELEEKKILMELVKAKCTVRMIVNIDIFKAVACGFTKTEICTRIADLCAVCDMFSSYNNFKVAVETGFVSYEPIYIMDKVLLTRQLNFTERGNYAFSQWSSDQRNIESECLRFDRYFLELSSRNADIMSVLGFHTVSELIFHYAQKKLNELWGE